MDYTQHVRDWSQTLVAPLVPPINIDTLMTAEVLRQGEEALSDRSSSYSCPAGELSGLSLPNVEIQRARALDLCSPFEGEPAVSPRDVVSETLSRIHQLKSKASVPDVVEVALTPRTESTEARIHDMRMQLLTLEQKVDSVDTFRLEDHNMLSNFATRADMDELRSLLGRSHAELGRAREQSGAAQWSVALAARLEVLEKRMVDVGSLDESIRSILCDIAATTSQRADMKKKLEEHQQVITQLCQRFADVNARLLAVEERNTQDPLASRESLSEQAEGVILRVSNSVLELQHRVVELEQMNGHLNTLAAVTQSSETRLNECCEYIVRSQDHFSHLAASVESCSQQLRSVSEEFQSRDMVQACNAEKVSEFQHSLNRVTLMMRKVAPREWFTALDRRVSCLEGTLDSDSEGESWLGGFSMFSRRSVEQVPLEEPPACVTGESPS